MQSIGKSLFLLVFSVGVVFGGYLTYKIFSQKKHSDALVGQTPVSSSPDTRVIETIYGTYTIDDPLIIELIDSPVLQRMKNVSQHGIVSFLDGRKKAYSRWPCA